VTRLGSAAKARGKATVMAGTRSFAWWVTFAALGVVALASASAAFDCSGSSPAEVADSGVQDAPTMDAGVINDALPPSDAPLPPVACRPGAAAVPCDAGGEYWAPLPDWPGWQPVTGLEPCCIVDRPSVADAAGPPMTWVACPDQPTGCLQLTNPPDAGPNGNPYIRTATVSQDDVGAAKYLQVRWALSLDASLVQDTIFDVASGNVVAAIRNDALSCYGTLRVASESAALLTQTSSGGDITVARGAVATFLDSPSFDCVWTVHASADGVQDYFMSDSTYAFDTAPSQIVFRTNANGGWAATYQSGPLTASLGLLLGLVANDDAYAFNNDGDFQHEYFVQPNGTPVLYRAAPNRFVTAFASDGTTMFWTESFGASTPDQPSTSFEAWAAPYTNDPATLSGTAHRVATLSAPAYPPIYGVASSGLYAVVTPLSTVTVVRLADGATTTVTPATSPSFSFDRVLYVTPTEIWATSSPDSFYTRNVRRYSLGTW
jgi:hypothetical protein